MADAVGVASAPATVCHMVPSIVQTLTPMLSEVASQTHAPASRTRPRTKARAARGISRIAKPEATTAPRIASPPRRAQRGAGRPDDPYESIDVLLRDGALGCCK